MIDIITTMTSIIEYFAVMLGIVVTMIIIMRRQAQKKKGITKPKQQAPYAQAQPLYVAEQPGLVPSPQQSISQKVICSNCQQDVKPRKFCTECGSRIIIDCPNCHRTMGINSFCTECGQKIEFFVP